MIPHNDRQITGGWLAGHRVRTANKPHRCDYWRGARDGGTCRAPIAPGEQYVEGEPDLDAENPWAMERYCLSCVARSYARAEAIEIA